MANFREDELTEPGADGREETRLDWSLMNFGPIALFRKDAVLADEVAWLERHGYAVARVDCDTCRTEEDVLWAIGQPLGFDRWPSPNLSGFEDDCRYLAVSEEGGTAVVLRRFEQIAERFPEFAWHVLDIFARASWDKLLFGRRLLCLVQSENPWIQFRPVGGRDPWWNSREWFDKDRA